MNNEMDDFSSKPGHPNAYGLIGSEANKIEPEKRRFHQCPQQLYFEIKDLF